MKLSLDEHDQAIVATVQETMKKAIAEAHNQVAVSKRIYRSGCEKPQSRTLGGDREIPF